MNHEYMDLRLSRHGAACGPEVAALDSVHVTLLDAGFEKKDRAQVLGHLQAT